MQRNDRESSARTRDSRFVRYSLISDSTLQLYFSALGRKEILRTAVQKVLTDGGFDKPEVAAAEKLLEWFGEAENQVAFGIFADGLISQLENCFKPHESVKRSREMMWEAFHKVRSTPAFRSKWSKFLTESIQLSAPPIFYQFVVDCVFAVLIKRNNQLNAQEEKEFDASLTFEEQNALRYTAGAVIKALLRKLKRSADPLKEEMTICLLELNRNEDVSKDESEDWTSLVDRGGLTHIDDLTYSIFVSMELEVKNFFSRHPSQLLRIKKELVKKIIENEDVLFYWALLSAEWEEEESRALLVLIAEHYVTIRGFSLASGWIEKYKQANKKSLQKSKGIRKQLIPPTQTSHHDDGDVELN